MSALRISCQDKTDESVVRERKRQSVVKAESGVESWKKSERPMVVERRYTPLFHPSINNDVVSEVVIPEVAAD